MIRAARAAVVLLLTVSCLGEVPSGEAISGDGVPIRYAVRGAGGPALVFVHGWAGDRTFWEAQVPHFARRHRVVTIDLAGHGESGEGREEWTVESFGADVAAVVEQLGLEEVVLIGHSVGGFVILEAAQRMPDRLVGVVGVETWHNPDQKVSMQQVDMVLAPLAANFVQATEMVVRMGMFPQDADAALVDRVVTRMAAAPPEIALPVSRNAFLWWNERAEESLRSVQAPIRAINSARSPTSVAAVRRHAPSFEVKTMEGVGHFVMMEDPETFNLLLEEVLADLQEPQTE